MEGSARSTSCTFRRPEHQAHHDSQDVIHSFFVPAFRLQSRERAARPLTTSGSRPPCPATINCSAPNIAEPALGHGRRHRRHGAAGVRAVDGGRTSPPLQETASSYSPRLDAPPAIVSMYRAAAPTHGCLQQAGSARRRNARWLPMRTTFVSPFSSPLKS